MGNQLVYYIKLQFSLSGCLSVPPLFFRHDRRTATKFGTHIRVDTGLILSLKKFTHPTPEGSHGGVGGFLGGQKMKSPGNVMNCPENPKKKSKRGGGWGGVEVLGVNIL